MVDHRCFSGSDGSFKVIGYGAKARAWFISAGGIKGILIDMANLTGLLRAVSFIGLGLSLVALSWLFQKFKAKPVALP